MSSPSGLELVSKVLWVARKECEEQQEDLHYKAIWKKMASLGVYLRLQTRYHDQLSPRYIGEDQQSPSLNWSNCEGEYKFLNKTELDKFLTMDGMPTAARALLYTMTGKHEICEYPPVWMAFTGIIDAGKYPIVRCMDKIIDPTTFRFWPTIPTTHTPTVCTAPT
jgi:hypothetical protein